MLAGRRPCLCPTHPQSIADADQEQTDGTLLCETHPEKCKQLTVNSTGLAISEAEQGAGGGIGTPTEGSGQGEGSPSPTGECVTLCRKGSCL